MDGKLIFDEIVLLIMSIAFNYFGLSLSFAPQQYKAFGTRLDRPLARSPIWFIRVVGILLVMVGFLLFYVLITKWHST
jgi:uncharacterized protein YjeT (DUF2065 family)